MQVTDKRREIDMAISRTKKKIREEEGLIDDAAMQQPAAPAPQPVPMPGAAPIAQAPADAALVPPQPGMIPTGWMFPQESAQAAVMDTGDVNMANAAPGGGVVGGAPISNEEAALVNEYRKWSKAKKLEALKGRLAKRVKENDSEDPADEGEDEVPSETDYSDLDEKAKRVKKVKEAIAKRRAARKLKEDEAFGVEEEPVEEDGEEMLSDDEGADIDIDDEMGVEGEDDILDEVKDIAIDINALFSDLGGDVDEVMPGSEEAEEFEAEEEAGEDLEGGDDEVEETESVPEEMPESKKRKTIKEASSLEFLFDKYTPGGGDDDEIEAFVTAAKRQHHSMKSLKNFLSMQFGGADDETLSYWVGEEDFDESKLTIRKALHEKSKAARVKKIKEAIAKRRAARKQESELAHAIDIKLPAGTPEPEITAEGKMQAYEKKVQARRALLAELRKKASVREQLGDGEYELANPDETIEDSVGDTVDDVMGNQRDLESSKPKSAVIKEAVSRSSKFVERYNEKKALDFKKLLSEGLLG